MSICYLRSCVHIIIHVIFINFIMLPFLFFVFLVVWLLTIFKHTNPISFVSVLNLLHFCSESVIRYICFRIRIRSLSAPLRIRRKHMVKAKSDPIWSVYIPKYNTREEGGGRMSWGQWRMSRNRRDAVREEVKRNKSMYHWQVGST
jgi:hypothetical protein